MFDDAQGCHRRHLIRELYAAAATNAARPHRHALLTAAAALQGCGTLLELTAAVLGDSNVLEAALALRQEVDAPLIVVYGHELGDSEGRLWIAKVVRSRLSGDAFARDLNGLVARFGQSIGKPDLVGLEPLERSELVSHLVVKDPQVRVGRHGVRWSAELLKVDR